MDFDSLLNLMIKAQKSSIRTGEEKKQFVLQNMEGDSEIGPLIDFLVMVLKDPAIHEVFLSTAGCLSRLCHKDTNCFILK